MDSREISENHHTPVVEAFPRETKRIIDGFTQYIKAKPEDREKLLPEITTSVKEGTYGRTAEEKLQLLHSSFVEAACDIFCDEKPKHEGDEEKVFERAREVEEIYSHLIVKMPESRSLQREDINTFVAEALKTARDRDFRKLIGSMVVLKNPPKEEPVEQPLLTLPALSEEQRDKMRIEDSVARVNQMAKEVEGMVIGSEEAIKIAVIALLSDAHLLMVGLPGEAKSMFANELFRRLEGKQFAITLKPGTTVEQLLGLPNFSDLKKSIYHIVPRGLPEANYAFLDELFRASPTILSSLLDILNERALREGLDKIDTPLLWAIAASNFTITDEAMDAVLDRFPYRVAVGEVTDDFDMYRVARAAQRHKAEVKKMQSPTTKVEVNDVLYLREVINGQNSHDIILPPHVLFMANMIASKVASTDDRGIAQRRISSRSRAHLPDVLRISALLDGRNVVKVKDLSTLGFVFAPAVMGDIKRDTNFFEGVANRRQEVARITDSTVQTFTQLPGGLRAIDTILTVSDIAQREGKVTPSDISILHQLPQGTERLNVFELVNLMNQVRNVVDHPRIEGMYQRVANLLNAQSQRGKI